MGKPLSKTRFRRISIIVVDWMIVAGHVGERPKMIVSDFARLAGENLSRSQVISKDLRRPVDHFGFSSFACTTTGSSLRVRSLWISTILAE